MNRLLLSLTMLIFCILFGCSTTDVNSSNDTFARVNSEHAVEIIKLTRLENFKGWTKDQFGQWNSFENKIIDTPNPNQSDNMKFLEFYELIYNGRKFFVINTGYLDYSSGTSSGYWVGNTYFPRRSYGSSTIYERNQFYFIEANKMKISLRDNKIVKNAIKVYHYGSFIAGDQKNINEELTEAISKQSNSSKYGEAEINIYTLNYKKDNVVRFYFGHYFRSSPHLSNNKVLDDYYYECSYEDFINVFRQWL